MKLKHIGTFFLIFFFTGVPQVFASVVISEIMYDLPGSDDPHEWVEIFNNGTSDVDISNWRFNDGSNHTLVINEEKGGQGSLTLAPSSYAILADSALDFLAQYPGFSGTVIDTVMSLNNTGDTLSLVNGESTVDSASYTKELGAAGDGNTLHRSGSGLIAGAPSPGSGSTEAPIPPEDEGTQSESSVIKFTPPDRRTISVDAGPDRETIAGADALFHADAFGLVGEELDGARFVWNFGDGAITEGPDVLHIYHFPGKYVVSVTVSSGKYSATDRVRVMVTDSPLVISTIQSGSDGYIALTNSASKDVNLSLWHLAVGEKYFTFPRDTYISAKETVKFPSRVTHLLAGAAPLALWYPNGVVAFQFGEATNQAITPAPSPKPKVSAGTQVQPTARKEEPVSVVVPPIKEEVSLDTQEVVAESASAAVVLSNPETTPGISLWILVLIGVTTIGALAVMWVLYEHRMSGGMEDEGEIIRREAESIEIL